MKAAAFDHVKATDPAQAVEILAGAGPDARMIAGGQSLVPMMAMRLVRPTLLVDISGMPALSGIDVAAASTEIRAVTRQVELEESDPVARHVPLLTAAMPLIGHRQTRNRGTVGGSLAHADPAAEIVLVALALDAEVSLLSISGERRLALSEFVVGPMETLARDDECLTGVRFPNAPRDLAVGAAIEEISPRAGDYAIIAAAAEIGLDRDGICRHARLAVSGASPIPLRAATVEQALLGRVPHDATIACATRLIDPCLDPASDLHASAAYRRRVAPGLLGRAIAGARQRASRVMT